jgi:hypothetical protein
MIFLLKKTQKINEKSSFELLDVFLKTKPPLNTVENDKFVMFDGT